MNSAKVSAIMKIAAMTDRAAPDTDASVSSCCRSLFSFLRSHRRHAHESWSSSLPERDEESRKRPENPWWSGVRFPCSGLGSASTSLDEPRHRVYTHTHAKLEKWHCSLDQLIRGCRQGIICPSRCRCSSRGGVVQVVVHCPVGEFRRLSQTPLQRGKVRGGWLGGGMRSVLAPHL